MITGSPSEMIEELTNAEGKCVQFQERFKRRRYKDAIHHACTGKGWMETKSDTD